VSATAAAARTVRYRVYGMDCAHDVADVERAAGAIPGIDGATVSLTAQAMTLRGSDQTALAAAVEAVAGLGYQVTPDDDRPAHLDPSYRRALWIVVLLNLGYGIVETVGGVLSGSQALRADALDFMGDGLISLLGLLALGWAPVWRARSALVQGGFLALMGVGVLGATAYRVIVQRQPDADLMGIFGLAAFAVNVGAALVLLPHRRGDANMRAVWLFSRNDAIGNLAVVVAAVLVAATGTPWPDLAVAFVIAGLFLHSAWRIILDARRELTAVA
jgi:Co/Zn/Cd efflux system component